MGKNTFILSDESKNKYGFIVKTDGIDTTDFERNPVMLYMHERKTVIGRWENIRKEGGKLYADAVFDDTTELGKTVKTQVEKGFLRSASIGVEVAKVETINNEKWAVKTKLLEASIVDIPANKNALKLYHKDGNIFLALEERDKVEDLKKAIIDLLGLENDATNEEIITEIEALLNASDETAIEVDAAIKTGLIELNARQDFIQMARISPALYKRFIGGEKQKLFTAIKTAVETAIKERRITFEQGEVFKTIGKTMGLSTLSRLLNSQSRPLRPSDIVNASRPSWGLSDFRKYAPEELKKDPKLYAQLIEQESANEESKNSLEYLRKHNPQYLQENPEIYKKLVSTI